MISAAASAAAASFFSSGLSDIDPSLVCSVQSLESLLRFLNHFPKMKIHIFKSLTFDVDDRLEHFITGADRSCIGIEPSLSDNHFTELLSDIDIG